MKTTLQEKRAELQKLQGYDFSTLKVYLPLLLKASQASQVDLNELHDEELYYALVARKLLDVANSSSVLDLEKCLNSYGCRVPEYTADEKLIRSIVALVTGEPTTKAERESIAELFENLAKKMGNV